MAQRMGAALRAYREAALPEAPARVLVELLAAQATRRGRDARRREAARWPGWRWVAAAAALTVVTFGAGFWVGHRSGEAPEPAKHDVISAPAPGVRLPEAPSIAFQAAPPMDAWTVSPAAVTVGTTPRDGVEIAAVKVKYLICF
jgi:hypothetical protein